MKRIIDLKTYPRRSHFEYFGRMAFPYVGLTANVEVTNLIRFAKERGAEIYDFRGVPKNGEENEHVGGLYRFKIGFCPEVTHFCGEFDYVFKPLVYKMVDVLTPLWKKLRNLLAKLRR